MKSKTLAKLFLRLMSVYVGLSGILSLRFSQATIEMLNFWQVMGMLGLAIVLPFVVACVLWWLSPLIASKFFTSADENQELNASFTANDLLVVGIKLVAIVSILKVLPNFLGNSVAVYQYAEAELRMTNQIVIWWFIGLIQLIVGFGLLIFTKRFIRFISDK